MAIQSNFPATKPSLLLDFANTKQLDPRITFTRASTATYYDGVTTAMAEQNLLQYSQAMNTAPWDTVSASVTEVSGTAPDGTTTANTITQTSTGVARARQTQVFQNGVVHTYSAYIKAGTAGYAAIVYSENSWECYVKVNMSTGAIQEAGNFSGRNTYVSSSITSVGNSWYRVSLVFTAFQGSSTDYIHIIVTDSTSWSGQTSPVNTTSVGTVLAWGAQLEQRSSATAYTATTTQAITNYIPVLQTAASGVARFDNNPTTGESLGLLIEESRTNICLYSSDLSNAAWTKTNATITADTIVAPDGTLTGDKLVENATTNVHSITQSVSVTSGTAYTATIYAKASQRSFLIIQPFGNAVFAYFNLSTGAVGTTSGSPTSTSMTSVGNGWYRCSITATAASTGAVNLIAYSAATDGNATYAGDGFSGIFIWGAQLEQGSFATSYIPTVASTVTRNADAASMTGTNFSSWYNFIEGALYTEASTVSYTSTSGNPTAMASIEDGTANNRLQNRFGGSVYSPRFVANGSSLLATTGVTTPINTFNKAIITYKSVNASSTYSSISAGNGAIIQSTSSAFSPASVNALLIGNGNTSAPLNGTVKKVAYYPIAVTSAQLQALTS